MCIVTSCISFICRSSLCKEEGEEAENFAHLAEYEEVLGNEYNLSVNKYVKRQEKKEEIDIKALNQSIKQIVEKQQALRISLDKIIEQLDKE